MTYDKGQCLNNLPLRWADSWSLSNLEYELRRRGMYWAILNEPLTEYQRKKLAAIVIEADAQIRACQSPHKTEEICTQMTNDYVE